MLKRFFFYGISGWGIEIIWTGLGSLLGGDLSLKGTSTVWMFLVYGCAVFLEPVHHALSKWHWLFRGLVWVLLIWTIEYTSGVLFYAILGVHPWYYTDRLAIQGMITLSYGPAWFLAGMVFERFHGMLDRYQIA